MTANDESQTLVTNSEIGVGDVADAAGVAIGTGATAVHVDALGDIGDVITGTKISLVNRIMAQRKASKRQVPPPPTGYISRTQAEQELADLLTAGYGEFHTVYLYGLPGAGKTWLARKVASSLDDTFVDGILGADLQTTNIRTAVWNFIEPFNETISRASLTSAGEFTSAMQDAIGDKRVLIVLDHLREWRENWRELLNWLPEQCQGCVILLIAHQAPANTAENESRYFLGGMTEEEALALFTQRLQDETGSLECDEETMKELAEQLDHIPGSIVDATRDINVKLISPADYLEGLKARGSAHEGTGRILGLETIYEALPAGGRAVLPYLGILRNVPWTADDLFAISPETNRTIEVGLVQLERAGLIDRLDAGTYRTPVAIGQFALSKLNEQGGQALVRAAMTLRTADIMRKVELILRFARQSLLGQCFTDDSTHEAIKQSIFNQFSKNERSGSGVAEESSLIAMHLDPLQEFFEDYVLTHHPYVQLWADMLDGFNIAMIRRQLEEVFDWAMEQEDWPLVQRFAYRVGVNSSWMLDTKLNGKLNERNWARFGFNFALLKKIRGTNAEMQGVCLKGSQLKYTVWNNCQFIGMEWPGAHVDSSTFSNVDMVGMVLPAGVVTGCTFKNVDARYGDFRGTIFQQCVFDNVNVRAAQLENAKFIDCYFGENVDLRLTVVEDAFAGRNSPTR